MKTPEPFCFNPLKIKAFVLGCDPTNFSDNGNSVPLNFVFGIGQDYRYFSNILLNLNIIGLHLEDLYIQNLVTEYLKDETGKNKEWKNVADTYLQKRKEEFDEIDPSGKVPVFLTAQQLYNFLLNPNQKPRSPESIYKNAVIPIVKESNKLDRPLIALFRHHKYNLLNWETYWEKLRCLF